MAWIRRQWTPEAADNWSREDWIASVLSALAYLLLILGSALAMLNLLIGYLLSFLCIMVAAAMYFVIDAKLRAISADYEMKQKQYLIRLEKITRWEKPE